MKIIFYCMLCLLFIICNIDVSFAQNEAKPKVTMFRGNPQLTGLSGEDPVYKVSGIKFSFKAGGSIRSTPAIADGNVFFGCGDGYFYAVDNQSGKEKWKFKTEGAIHSSPAIINETIFFSNRDNYLYALQTTTGKELWKFKMGQDIGKENYWDNYLSSPVIYEGTLFVGSGDGGLYAFNIATKKLLWKYNAEARIRTAPAVYENHVVFGTNSGFLIDVNRKTGKLQWKFATDGASNTFESKQNDRTSIYCSPSIADGIVVSGGRDGIAYGIDLITGKEKWRNDHKGPWILSTAIKDGVAFIGCGSDYLLQALDLKTGNEKWRLKIPSAIFSSLTIAGNIIYFNDLYFNGNLHAVDCNTGIEKWNFPIGYKSFSTPVVKNGVVYCGAENGKFYALQGSAEADPATLVSKKIIYWQGKINNNDLGDFQNSVDLYVRDFFIANGYELMNATQLEDFMKEQLNHKSRSVIVFADNRFPKNISKDNSQKPLVRRYLDAGGKIVLFGLNPLAFVNDSAGRIIAVDDSIPEAIFGLKYAERKLVRGIYEFHPTTEGRKYGLYSSFTGISNSTVISPDQFTKTLAIDEFGSTTEWIKNYGSSDGTGLLQLWIPTNEVSPNLSELRTVIEYGITW